MSDRELLELAAKAYADPLISENYCGGPYGGFSRWIGRNEDMGCDVSVMWNPLTDDGDALRLSVKLDMEIYRSSRSVEASWTKGVEEIRYEDCESRGEATRRAIVRAAAEIGRNMP